jgi:hypothetical protein
MAGLATKVVKITTALDINNLPILGTKVSMMSIRKHSHTTWPGLWSLIWLFLIMMHPVATIASLWLRLRMPRGVIRMHARALANMKYFVKTAHGIWRRFTGLYGRFSSLFALDKVVAHPRLYGSRWWSAFF